MVQDVTEQVGNLGQVYPDKETGVKTLESRVAGLKLGYSSDKQEQQLPSTRRIDLTSFGQSMTSHNSNGRDQKVAVGDQ